MSEKKRQKKDGQNTDKKNKAARESRVASAPHSSEARRQRERPAPYGQGLPRNDIEESK